MNLYYGYICNAARLHYLLHVRFTSYGITLFIGLCVVGHLSVTLNIVLGSQLDVSDVLLHCGSAFGLLCMYSFVYFLSVCEPSFLFI